MSTQVATLFARIDDYAEARQLVGRTDNDAPEFKAALDRACDAWRQLLETRNSFQPNTEGKS